MEILELSDYNIYIGAIENSLPQFLSSKSYARVVVICDEHTAEFCLPVLQKALAQPLFAIIKILSGEQHKNIDTCQLIWQQMMNFGVDRKALIINLGGGVIGDMGGFCAATFKRGVDFIQIPTTLLAQVDASIGGKLGIDFAQVKNSVGVFQNPKAVLIDPVFLKTLPFREIRSGFAEIIKHSLIADAPQWADIQKNEDLRAVNWAALILPSLKIKQHIVAADPFEQGLRKALNFGHTIGHAVESLFLETAHPRLHGEAIAVGMICEAYLAHKLLDLPEVDLHTISHFLIKTYGHQAIEEHDFETLLQFMQNDKKNEHFQTNFSLINPIGRAVINQTTDSATIIESFRYYNNLGGISIQSE